MPAALAPEELELLIPEKVTNVPQVSADLDGIEILQLNHRSTVYGLVNDIQETCVKVFNNIAEFAKPCPSTAKTPLALGLDYDRAQPFLLLECCGLVNAHPWPFRQTNSALPGKLHGESTEEVLGKPAEFWTDLILL